MTDGPWWDSDPAEQPIPLTPHPEETAEKLQRPLAVAEEAQCIVLESQAAIRREETDPALPLWTPGGKSLWSVPVGRWAVALLAVGCIGMFAAGWLQGAPGGVGDSAAVMGVTPADRSMSPTALNEARGVGVEQ